MDKNVFTFSEKITGRAYINSTAVIDLIQKEHSNSKGTYGFYGIKNAIGIIPETKENKASYYSEHYVIENAIIIKNDTAFFSFTLPASVRRCKQYQLQVHRTWESKGRDTILVAKNLVNVIQ